MEDYLNGQNQFKVEQIRLDVQKLNHHFQSMDIHLACFPLILIALACPLSTIPFINSFILSLSFLQSSMAYLSMLLYLSLFFLGDGIICFITSTSISPSNPNLCLISKEESLYFSILESEAIGYVSTTGRATNRYAFRRTSAWYGSTFINFFKYFKYFASFSLFRIPLAYYLLCFLKSSY